jgi:16S rRNA (adenine1518-N6/adenine1519-N6)-dimethyltransferase
VALRMKAEAGSEHYGPLSVMAQLLAKVEVLRTLPPQAFWPMPKVSSSLVRMRRQDRLGGKAGEFGRFVHGVFSYRRKMLHKALSEAGEDPQLLLQATGFSSRMRPEELSADQWLALFDAGERGKIKPASTSSAASEV